ncbi:MAG: hypothetical protein AB4038_08385, partial [Prochloraceae cyanobacterium]
IVFKFGPRAFSLHILYLDYRPWLSRGVGCSDRFKNMSLILDFISQRVRVYHVCGLSFSWISSAAKQFTTS